MSKNEINFKTVLSHWDSALFSEKLIDVLMGLKTGVLPLQHGLTQGDMAAEQPSKITLLNCHETEKEFVVKMAVFFTEIISGCSCGDDPATLNGYCEMLLTIDKQTAAGVFQVTD